MSDDSDDLEIIYKNKKPYGIRDRSGYLLFFREITKYPGQEERYRREASEMESLAGYILDSLIIYKISGI